MGAEAQHPSEGVDARPFAGNLTCPLLGATADREYPDQAEVPCASLPDQIPAVLYVTAADEGFKPHYVSPQVEQLVGHPPERFCGDPSAWPDLLRPEDRDWIQKERRRCLQAGEPLNAEYRVITDGGAEKWVHDRATVIRDDQGVPLCIQGVVTEISARKRSERSLQESNALLERIFDTTHMLIAYMDTDFNFIRVNRAYAQADGHRADFFVGKNHFDLYPHEENEAIFNRVRETGEPYFVRDRAFEYPDSPERGTTYWDWSLQPVRDGNGEVEGLLLCLVDVTDRKRAQLRLAEQKELLETIVGNIPVMLVFYDADGAVEFVNRAFEELIGWSAAELEEVDVLAECIPRPDRRREVWELMIDPQAGWEDIEVRTRGGEVRQTCWASVEVPGNSYVSIGIDISERKEAEQSIRRYQHELQSLAFELSRAEQKERRRIAEALHDHIGQTLALSKLKLGTVGESLSEPEPAEALEQVRSLIQQAIDYTRSLMFEISPAILYEMGLTAALAKLAGRMEQEHAAAVRLRGRQQRPLPEALRVALFHCARELLVNAVEHADPALVEVTVRRSGDRLVVTVEDDGKGFDASEAGLHQHRDGGFGLFGIRERMGRLGGELRIDSEPGRGTRARLRVPLPKDDPEDA